ncbi:MAG: type II secretion system F family protein [Chitinivibrionia bacterium]|jgi:type IV pilus assembly protein PilC|nr:type II secretion system F family protein [Chitinivibrionia bacterium]
MPIYMYAGTDKSGNQVSGELNAKDRTVAINILRSKRIRTTMIRQKPKSLQIPFLSGGVKVDDLSRFTRQFSAMASAGLPLVQCMDILAEQTENTVLQEALKKVSIDIQSGNTLADSLRKHPKIFTELYCNMVSAGEQSGDLDGILNRLATYMEKSSRLQRKIKGAMAYPLILSIIAVGATAVLLTFVVPQFAGMFTDMGGALPAPTRIVMDLSDFLQSYILHIIAGIAVGAFLFRRWYKTPPGHYATDAALLKVPVLGDLLRKTAVSRFSETLATLLAAGVGILQALDITARTSGNKVIEKGLLGSLEKITAGHTIAEPLQQTGLFPPMVTHMISVGEKTGDISSMLEKVAAFYEEEVDAAVDAVMAMMEPIMIVVMGAVIGGLLIAMYLPMFDMIGLVG